MRGELQVLVIPAMNVHHDSVDGRSTARVPPAALREDGEDTMSFEVPFIKPSFPTVDDLRADLEGIATRNVFTNRGPVERRFAIELGGYIGQNVAVSVTANATLALLLAVRTLFQPDGRYGIVQSFTFPACAEALLWSGFQPVFIDVDPLTWQPSIEQARRYVETVPGCAGILLCNTFGCGNPGIGEWESFADAAGLPLVVDSAAGFGSTYPDGAKLGGRGSCEIFSFHATKTFAIGEGGAVASSDHRLIDSLDALKNFGLDEQRRVTMLGLNAKLPEIDSSIGLRQLAQFDTRLEARRANLERYRQALSPHGITFQPETERSALQFLSALLPDGPSRDALARACHDAGIETRDYYNPPLHRMPLFARCEQAGPLDVTLDLTGRILSLPIHEHVRPADIDRVASLAVTHV